MGQDLPLGLRRLGTFVRVARGVWGTNRKQSRGRRRWPTAEKTEQTTALKTAQETTAKTTPGTTAAKSTTPEKTPPPNPEPPEPIPELPTPEPTTEPSPEAAPTGGSAAPLPGGECPDGFPIKGNAQSHIYHVPGGAYYGRTKAEQCFATEQDAQNAGFRKSQR